MQAEKEAAAEALESAVKQQREAETAKLEAQQQKTRAENLQQVLEQYAE